MKKTNKLLMAMCLALIACLVAPALLPAGLNAATSARAEAALSKTRATIYNGKTLALKVTGTSRAVRWSSSNTTVAKVSKKGVVTAKKVGKATITATVGTKRLTCVVKVVSPLNASATQLTLDPGKTKKVTLNYKLSGKLSLKKYDSSVLKCSLGQISNGTCTLTIKAVRAGTQTVTVKNSKTGDVAKIKVTVNEAETDDPIVDKTEVTVKAGKTAKVKVTWPYSGLPNMRCDDSDVVTCKWGEWQDDGWPVYIKGEGKGTATVWFTKSSDSSDAHVAEIRVTVE